MNKSGYLPRVIDGVIDDYLEAFGAIEVAGTMWSGKTWSAEAHAASEISLVNDQTRLLAQIDTSAILDGATPRVIDEWQEVPQIWDVVRQKVDGAAGDKGRYILTGSSSPVRGKVHHSGAGRIAKLRMWPMSMYELGVSDGTVSLAGLFNGEFSSGSVQVELQDLARQICRGGWPAAIRLSDRAASLVPSQYIDAFVEGSVGKCELDTSRLKSLLASLARNVGQSATLRTLAKDVYQTDSPQKSQQNAIADGLSYINAHYVATPMGGWDAPIKSPSRLRTKPKQVFADPSLTAALLNASPNRLMQNMQLFGQLFEELCLRDLNIYASALPGFANDGIKYYRDSDGLEVDVIIELADGRWAAIEVKLGANKVDRAESSLQRLIKKVAANPQARNPAPTFTAVLVGKTDYKYVTERGTYVIPITTLAP